MAKYRTPKREVGKHKLTGKTVDELSSSELQAQLVTDALTGHPTYLPWFVAACQRIADLDKIDLEDAYQRVRQEVMALGGFMPGAPGQ